MGPERVSMIALVALVVTGTLLPTTGEPWAPGPPAPAIVDVGPFSTNGALMLVTRPDGISEPVHDKQILSYSVLVVLVVLVGPLVLWAGLILPGW